MVCLQFFQAALHRFPDCLRAAVHLQMIALMLYTALCSQDDLITIGFQCLPHKLFVVGGAPIRVHSGITFCSIKHGITYFYRLSQQLCRLLYICRRAGCMCHSHTSQPDSGYFKILPKNSGLHHSFLPSNPEALPCITSSF